MGGSCNVLQDFGISSVFLYCLNFSIFQFYKIWCENRILIIKSTVSRSSRKRKVQGESKPSFVCPPCMTNASHWPRKKQHRLEYPPLYSPLRLLNRCSNTLSNTCGWWVFRNCQSLMDGFYIATKAPKCFQLCKVCANALDKRGRSGISASSGYSSLFSYTSLLLARFRTPLPRLFTKHFHKYL